MSEVAASGGFAHRSEGARTRQRRHLGPEGLDVTPLSVRLIQTIDVIS